MFFVNFALTCGRRRRKILFELSKDRKLGTVEFAVGLTALRNDGNCIADNMALMSANASWRAAAPSLAAPQSCGLKESRIACPISWQTMSGLSPEKTVPVGDGP